MNKIYDKDNEFTEFLKVKIDHMMFHNEEHDIKAITKLIKAHPDNVKYRNEEAKMWNFYKKYASALEAIYETLEIDSESAMAYICLLYTSYMLPYEAAVEAGVGSVMASFNEVDGIPATANKWLMTDILRGQWGFNGFVVTDYTGISEMIDHGIGDLQTVSARAINAGVDMDCLLYTSSPNIKDL